MTRIQVRPVGGFSRTMAQTMLSHARVCFLEAENSKIISNPWTISPKSKIGTKNGLRNFRPKTLLYESNISSEISNMWSFYIPTHRSRYFGHAQWTFWLTTWAKCNFEALYLHNGER